MAIYALRNTASLEVLSIVEYDGSSSYSYLTELGLELYSGSMIEEFTAQEHTPYDLYDPIHGLHITSEVGSVLKGFNYISGSLSLIGDVYSTGSQYLEGELNLVGGLNALGDVIISGSLNISGSVVLGDENFDETFKIAPKPCTILKYEEDVINQLPTDGGINPQGGYFIFDKDVSIDGDQYGEDSWRFEKPTKIRLNLQSLGDTTQQNEYETKLFEIIKGRLGDSEIVLEQIIQNQVQPAIKHFKITNGIYRERSRRKDVNQEYPVRYYYLNWGSQNFVETDRYFGQEDIDYFYGDGPFGLDFNAIGKNSARDGFFEFDVEEIQPLNVNPDIKPEQDAEFKVCITKKYKRREVTIFTESGEYWVPSWCDDIIMFAIGAGGGGGGGSWGYPYRLTAYDTVRPTLKNKDGFELAFGGGGGAGGSIAKSSYKYNQIAGSKLNVFVGSPGKGGVGLDNTFDFPTTSFLFNSQLNENNMLNALYGKQNGVAINYDAKYFGKKGGDSVVYGTSGTVYVKAQGGSGGNMGVSIKGNYPIYYDGFAKNGINTLDYGLVRTGKSSATALGGGGSIKNSFGNEFAYPGGSGGYGSHTVPFRPRLGDSDDKKNIEQSPFIVKTAADVHVAPNIPASNRYNTHIRGYNESIPMGRVYDNLSTNDGRLEILSGKYLSTEKNTNYISPPGGGGGFGVRMTELADNVPFSTRSSMFNTFIIENPVVNGVVTPLFLAQTQGIVGAYRSSYYFEYGSRMESQWGNLRSISTRFKSSNLITQQDLDDTQLGNITDGFLEIRNCDSTTDNEMELVISGYQKLSIAPGTFFDIATILQRAYLGLDLSLSRLKTVIISDNRNIKPQQPRVVIYEVVSAPRKETEVVTIGNNQQTLEKVIITVKELYGYDPTWPGQVYFDQNYGKHTPMSTYELINDTTENAIISMFFSDISWLNSDTTDVSLSAVMNNPFLSIVPLDGIQRFETANRYAKLGVGGSVMINNTLIYEIGYDNNGNAINLTIENGGNGGFGRYFSVGRGKELRPDLSNTLPEDVSGRYGVGGGGGAAIFLRDYEDKFNLNSGDPNIPSKGQDGADGGPGLVVIIAEKNVFE